MRDSKRKMKIFRLCCMVTGVSLFKINQSDVFLLVLHRRGLLRVICKLQQRVLRSAFLPPNSAPTPRVHVGFPLHSQSQSVELQQMPRATPTSILRSLFPSPPPLVCRSRLCCSSQCLSSSPSSCLWNCPRHTHINTHFREGMFRGWQRGRGWMCVCELGVRELNSFSAL